MEKNDSNLTQNFSPPIDWYREGVDNYFRGNYERSLEYLLKATENISIAHYLIGMQYLRGNGTEVNLKKAIYFLRSSDSEDSNFILGTIFYNGHNEIEKNEEMAQIYFEKSFENFLKSANLGDPQSMNVIGNFYRVGIGKIGKNIEKAIEFYTKAFSNQYTRASLGLARIFHYEKNYVDYKKAINWYLKSNNEDGTFGCGLIYYYDGHCLNLEGNENQYKIAYSYFEKGAATGHTQSLSMLGWMNNAFNTKVKGIQQNNQLSIECYKKASEKGDRFSVNHLACAYESGVGVEKNPKLALQFHLEAAEKKCVDSYLHLGIMHEKGNLIEQNIEESKKWFQKVEQEATLNELLKISDDYQYGEDDLDLDRKRSMYYLRKALDVYGNKEGKIKKISEKYRKFYQNETHSNLKNSLNNNFVDCKIVVTFDNDNISNNKKILGKRKRDEEFEKRKRLKKK